MLVNYNRTKSVERRNDDSTSSSPPFPTSKLRTPLGNSLHPLPPRPNPLPLQPRSCYSLRLLRVSFNHGHLRLFLIAALLQLRPRACRSLAVGNETDSRKAIDEHLRGVELRAHAELGRGVVKRVLVVPVTHGNVS